MCFYQPKRFYPIAFVVQLWVAVTFMANRLHSAKTLEEGMNQVGFGDIQARKRELEAKIAAT